MPAIRYGGCFAPPMTPERLSNYKLLAATASPPIVKEWMEKLIEMVEVFQQTPESAQPGTPHPSGMGTIVPLEDSEVQRIDQYVPYREELDLISQIFDQIPNDPQNKPTRNAAFHLRWFAGQLCLDREPITTDRLPQK